MEKKRDVCREYESGSGEHLIFSHSATMSESALILVSICCHTRSSCKHARERQHMQERESSNQTNGQEKIKRKWVREGRREGGRGGAVREKNNAYGECERERACARTREQEQKERVSMSVCVWLRTRMCVRVCVWVSVCLLVFACVCM